jgi:hypothetical protein
MVEDYFTSQFSERLTEELAACLHMALAACGCHTLCSSGHSAAVRGLCVVLNFVHPHARSSRQKPDTVWVGAMLLATENGPRARLACKQKKNSTFIHFFRSIQPNYKRDFTSKDSNLAWFHEVTRSRGHEVDFSLLHPSRMLLFNMLGNVVGRGVASRSIIIA